MTDTLVRMWKTYQVATAFAAALVALCAVLVGGVRYYDTLEYARTEVPARIVEIERQQDALRADQRATLCYLTAILDERRGLDCRLMMSDETRGWLGGLDQ